MVTTLPFFSLVYKLQCAGIKLRSNPQRRRVRREEQIFPQESLRTGGKIASLQISRPKSNGFQ